MNVRYEPGVDLDGKTHQPCRKQGVIGWLLWSFLHMGVTKMFYVLFVFILFSCQEMGRQLGRWCLTENGVSCGCILSRVLATSTVQVKRDQARRMDYWLTAYFDHACLRQHVHGWWCEQWYFHGGQNNWVLCCHSLVSCFPLLGVCFYMGLLCFWSHLPSHVPQLK
jgi:hypothetical protein